MDPVAMIISMVKGGVQAFAWAQEQGYVGGSKNWQSLATSAVTFLDEHQALIQAGKDVLARLLADPAEYDRLAALPQAQLEAEIRARVYPTQRAVLVGDIRERMGLPRDIVPQGA